MDDRESIETSQKEAPIFGANYQGVCALCGVAAGRKDFLDELSWREFSISSLCQACQDAFFGKPQPAQPRDNDADSRACDMCGCQYVPQEALALCARHSKAPAHYSACSDNVCWPCWLEHCEEDPVEDLADTRICKGCGGEYSCKDECGKSGFYLDPPWDYSSGSEEYCLACWLGVGPNDET